MTAWEAVLYWGLTIVQFLIAFAWCRSPALGMPQAMPLLIALNGFQTLLLGIDKLVPAASFNALSVGVDLSTNVLILSTGLSALGLPPRRLRLVQWFVLPAAGVVVVLAFAVVFSSSDPSAGRELAHPVILGGWAMRSLALVLWVQRVGEPSRAGWLVFLAAATFGAAQWGVMYLGELVEQVFRGEAGLIHWIQVTSLPLLLFAGLRALLRSVRGEDDDARVLQFAALVLTIGFTLGMARALQLPGTEQQAPLAFLGYGVASGVYYATIPVARHDYAALSDVARRLVAAAALLVMAVLVALSAELAGLGRFAAVFLGVAMLLPLPMVVQRPRRVEGGNARYQPERLLASGGFGDLYQAYDRRLGRRVVLKRPRAPASAEEAAQLEREARIMGEVHHPNVVAVLDFDVTGLSPSIVLEYVDGGSLAERLETVGRLTDREAASIICDVLDGLDAVHARGIVHGDVKPGNILLTRGGTAKLADFGVARAGDGARDMRGSLTSPALGTRIYQSPEQARGDPAGPQSDLYSLGLVLFEMLSGVPPASPPDGAATLVNLASIPEAWRGVVATALASTPGSRFSSARAMREAVRAVSPGTLPSTQRS